MHIRAAQIIYGLDWYTPGQEVLALTKWNTIRTIFNRKLLSLAYNCYYGQSPAALQSLFTKSSPVYNFRRKMIFSLRKPGSDM